MSASTKIEIKINLLKQFQNKACAWQSQQKAKQIWMQLLPYLTDDEKMNILVSWDHYETGEGSSELHKVCNSIILKLDE